MFNFLKKKQEVLKAPLSGELVQINDIPDEAFAQKMIGDGIAIKPTNPYLVSPSNGVVVQKFSTNHALGIKTDRGLEILLHMGIDTVELKGEGFEPLIKEGQQVTTGQKLLKIDWDIISEKAPSTISPIIITNMELVESIEVMANKTVETGDDLLSIKIKNN
ncbi:MAG: PTS glucose transporter subunit IIA [Firmicutes bacterium]|nr:PTS glucose transporter subunit IIA [Bacillota bacterium]